MGKISLKTDNNFLTQVMHVCIYVIYISTEIDIKYGYQLISNENSVRNIKRCIKDKIWIL